MIVASLLISWYEKLTPLMATEIMVCSFKKSKFLPKHKRHGLVKRRVCAKFGLKCPFRMTVHI